MLTDALIETPAQHLANAFAEHVVAWAKDHDAPDESLDLLRHVAWLASMGTTEGHVCLLLDDLVPSYQGANISDLRRLLLASGVVGTGADPGTLPLVLDDDGRVYLHRYFHYECRLAQRLLAANSDAFIESDSGSLARLLAELFGPMSEENAEWQRIAAALALKRKLTIISGGPGTGKTTTVANLLACLLQQNPSSRIALAAPTGKAAARMMEAMRSRASRLPHHLQELLPDEAFTIHRLLGVLPSGRFVHHAGNPLPLDILVIDEASMLDIALATHLFDAVPPHGRIVLLGDKDQLAAVEAGAVFSELSAAPSLSRACIASLSELTGIPVERIADPAPLPSASPSADPLLDSVVWLNKSHRFSSDSGIGRLAADINAGAAEHVIAWLRSAQSVEAFWIEEDVLPDARTANSMHEGYAAYLASLKEEVADKTAIFMAFDRFRVLCALREGPRGVAEVNHAIAREFRRALAHRHDRDLRSEWYPGRPIMIQKNDYVLKLYNGDIGIVLPDDAGKLMAWFTDDRAGFRAIPLARLPQHETAFAMTVHKSQGSEFDAVMLLLPSRPSRIVTRELIYTAITRARKAVILAGSETVLKTSIMTRTQRRSGLARRLQDARLVSLHAGAAVSPYS